MFLSMMSPVWFIAELVLASTYTLVNEACDREADELRKIVQLVEQKDEIIALLEEQNMLLKDNIRLLKELKGA